jgi:hypothetical protein
MTHSVYISVVCITTRLQYFLLGPNILRRTLYSNTRVNLRFNCHCKQKQFYGHKTEYILSVGIKLRILKRQSQTQRFKINGTYTSRTKPWRVFWGRDDLASWQLMVLRSFNDSTLTASFISCQIRWQGYYARLNGLVAYLGIKLKAKAIPVTGRGGL